MKLSLKKVLILVLITMMAFSFSACKDKDSSVEDDAKEVDVNTGETEITGRSAIIFKTECEGDSTVIVLRGEESLETYEGMRLTKDDNVICSTGAQCYIRIDDDKNILLGEDTTMSISELKDGAIKLTLVNGEFFCDVENKLDDDETMEFDVGGTTLSIRGTSFSGSLPKVASGELAKIQVYDGLVSLKDSNNSEKYLVPGQAQEFSLSESGKTEFNGNTQYAETNGLVLKYLGESSSYSEKLKGEGWTINSDNTIYISEETVNGHMDAVVKANGFSVDSDGNIIKSNSESNEKQNNQENQGNGDNGEGTTTYVTLPCGHRVEAGNEAGHEKLPCGHYACSEGDHTLAACGTHYKCSDNYDAEEHEKLLCGHYACEEGDHTLAACGTHYKCSADYDSEEHEKLLCGHYACEEGDHTLAACGTHYKCSDNYDAEEHEKLLCGHYACEEGDHTLALCGDHYKCASSYDATKHVKCAHCGEYICDGEDHTTLLPCGHYACEEGDHTLAACGTHYKCSANYNATDHILAPCGNHYICSVGYEAKDHFKLPCGHYKCDLVGETPEEIAEHTTVLDCGHYKCQVDDEDLSEHQEIDPISGTDSPGSTFKCGGLGICDNCVECFNGLRTPATSVCDTCGMKFCESCSRYLVACSEDGCDKVYCEFCILRDIETQSLGSRCEYCDEFYCTEHLEDHEIKVCTICGVRTCSSIYGTHVEGECPVCHETVCLGNHTVFECGKHCTTENANDNEAQHAKCAICGKLQCESQVSFHYCENCGKYYCSEYNYGTKTGCYKPSDHAICEKCGVATCDEDFDTESHTFDENGNIVTCHGIRISDQ